MYDNESFNIYENILHKTNEYKITNINFMLHNCSIVCMYANTLIANKNGIAK